MSENAPAAIPAVILAGGRGARLGNAAGSVPKPMAVVHGRPFVEWIVRRLAAEGVRRFFLSTGHLGEQVAAHFNRSTLSLDIRCVQERRPLDTAGGFLNCASRATPAPDWWLVCNGDSLVGADLSRLFRLAETASDMDGAILAAVADDALPYGGLDVAASGELTAFAEKRRGRGLVNAGLYLLRDRFVRAMGPVRRLSFEQRVFPMALKNGARFRVLADDAPFLDIGTPASLARAPEFVAKFCMAGDERGRPAPRFERMAAEHP